MEYVVEVIAKHNTKYIESVIYNQFSSFKKISFVRKQDLFVFNFKTDKRVDILKLLVYIKKENDIFIHKIFSIKGFIKKCILNNNLRHIMYYPDTSSDNESDKVCDYISSED
uniref:Uncharacterized protein n=1 Tax=viral metagenome TaxID=1070528 RepID=A0A6C0LHP1_9ZZZZ